MKSSAITLLPLLSIAAACGGSGSETANEAPAATQSAIVSNALNENQILGKIYDPNYFVPDNFFVDERAETTTRSYTVHHVLDDSASYEMCSDDLVEAQQWEAADNASRAVSGAFVNSIENERYFEFVRELSYDSDVGNVNDPTSPGYARVFKCSYANRNGVDRSLLDGYSGQLGSAMASTPPITEFVEYLWQFRFFSVSRKIVLDSHGVSADEHTLQLAFLVNQGNQQCDRVDVVEWRFTRDPNNGYVSRQFDTVHSFEAENETGSPQLCK